MKTFATKEKQSAPAVSRSHHYVHYPMGSEQQPQQAEIRRILRATGAQAKLTIGQPNDKYEQEADRIADKIMHMPEPKIQRRCGECEEDEGGWPDFRIYEGGVVAEGRTGTPITGGIVFIPRKYTFPDEGIVVSTRWNIEERRRLYRRVRSVFRKSAKAQREKRYGSKHTHSEERMREKWNRFVVREARAVAENLKKPGRLNIRMLKGFYNDLSVLNLIGGDSETSQRQVADAFTDRVHRVAGRIMRQREPKRGAIRSLIHLVNIAQLAGADIDPEALEFLAEYSSRATAPQRNVGKQPIQRLVKSEAVQANLKIGQPNDKYEQEADRVADEVMRMPEPERLPQSKEGKNFMSPMSTNLPISTPVISSTNSDTLSPWIRSYFESRFGADFSQVRIHKDSKAAEFAQSINARAYTFGRDVVFGSGQYSPETMSGKRLLAHELAHVVQQHAHGLPGSAQHGTGGGMVMRKPAGSEGIVQRQPSGADAPAPVQEYVVREVAEGKYQLYTNRPVSPAYLDKYGFKLVKDWKDPDYSPYAKVWRGPQGCIIWSVYRSERTEPEISEEISPDEELSPSEKKYGWQVHEEEVPLEDGGVIRVRHYHDGTIETEEDTPNGTLITTYQFVDGRFQMSTSDNADFSISLPLEDLPYYLK